jgi:indole-3-glycerol phosphate synthase
MNKYLEQIIENKRKEVAARREIYPVKLLEKSVFFATQPVSLKKYLHRPGSSGVIAEFKRKSPSKGWINEIAQPAEVTLGYMQSGAAGLSVLTDKDFFAGSFADLIAARKENYCPVLQKDFMLEEYQIIESKSIGADAILLIAAVLDAKHLKAMTQFAHSLKMEVIVEIHDEAELKKVPEDADIVGINNRNLKTFEVDLDNSAKLLDQLPAGKIKIAESGIQSPEDGAMLRKMGFDGLLIGELFMKAYDPVPECRRFIKKLNRLMAEK